MDTAQRGMGLSFEQATELIRRSAARAGELGAVIASGAGTDQLPGGPHSLAAIIGAYTEQVELVQSAGGPDGLLRALRSEQRHSQSRISLVSLALFD